MTPESQRHSLPFEPKKKRQKSVKNPQTSDAKKLHNPQKVEHKSSEVPNARTPLTKEEMAVPKIVSDRMARRMALFCGVPTALGMASFILGYFIKSYAWFKLPNLVVLLVSIGCFGLGVLGLSYGVLSASWDEERVGSKLGWGEFKLNWGRMTSAWRSTRQKGVKDYSGD